MMRQKQNRTLLKGAAIAFKATPFLTILNIFFGIIHALSFSLQIVATNKLFDAITLAAKGLSTFVDCLLPLLVLAFIMLLEQVLNGLHNYYMNVVLSPASEVKLSSRLHKKLSDVDAVLFEDTEFLDDLNKATAGAKEVGIFYGIIYVLISLYGVYFASIGVYLFTLKPILLVILLLAFIPAILSHITRVKKFTALEEESAPLRRENDYYRTALTSIEYFKETRMLGAFGYFNNLYKDTLELLRTKEWSVGRETSVLQLLLNLSSFIGMGIASYLLFVATLNGEITVGAFAAVFSSLNLVFALMQEIVGMHMGNMSQNSSKVMNYIKVFDIPSVKGTDGIYDRTAGIVVEHIFFAYPNSDKNAIEDLSLTISPEETVAIVGENGAGKSTLVRLLTGIYRPASGKVTIGGLDTKTTNPEILYMNSSGVFQNYGRFKMTLTDNVSISDTTSEPDMRRVEQSLEQADAEFDISYDTVLSPEFDGVDLSGGEWQRVAIARGLYRTNDFIVLDEPTSAIDPIEEREIFTKFQQLAEGKAALIVTHRLGSARLADRILVMQNGSIVDSGSHEELLEHDGVYAAMWHSQAQWYER
ncbi:MAG: ABC transporter ATP-binding protein/permease [Oscillospiraceae bacterium]|nr:ABC transporter ATP-binding protein/permease [Oscillospiraceae bacterium]